MPRPTDEYLATLTKNTREYILSLEQKVDRLREILPTPAVCDDGVVWLHIHANKSAVCLRYAHPREGQLDMDALREWAEKCIDIEEELG